MEGADTVVDREEMLIDGRSSFLGWMEGETLMVARRERWEMSRGGEMSESKRVLFSTSTSSLSSGSFGSFAGSSSTLASERRRLTNVNHFLFLLLFSNEYRRITCGAFPAPIKNAEGNEEYDREEDRCDDMRAGFTGVEELFFVGIQKLKRIISKR